MSPTLAGPRGGEDLAADYHAAREAFARPALALLHKDSAPLVVTAFRTAFTGETTTLPQPQFRRHVGSVIEVLQAHGLPVPDRDPSPLCASWVRDGWLISASTPAGEDVYELTADALDALRTITELGSPQLVSSPRVHQILSMVEQAAQAASANRDVRIAHLEREIAVRKAELDRLNAGAELESAGFDEMAQRYERITRELASLPADFRRVRELVEHARKEMVARIVTGDGPVGLLLDQAVTASLRSMDDTAEGRAFMGVADLLNRDATHLRELRRNAEKILGHEFAEALSEVERRDFADVAAVFRNNIELVLGEFRTLSGAVEAVTARHSRGTSRREVGQVIQHARKALLGYRGSRIPGIPRLERAAISGIAQRLYDPDTAPPPRPLAEFAGSEATPMTPEELARWGGPHMARLDEHIGLVAAVEGGPVTLSKVWQESPGDLRRAVELTGYLALATRSPDARIHRRKTETVTTVRPDGSELDWNVPLVLFNVEDGS